MPDLLRNFGRSDSFFASLEVSVISTYGTTIYENAGG